MIVFTASQKVYVNCDDFEFIVLLLMLLLLMLLLLMLLLLMLLLLMLLLLMLLLTMMLFTTTMRLQRPSAPPQLASLAGMLTSCWTF